MKKILVIPASGSGNRMGQAKPKQYLKLNNGLSILDTTISRLLVEKPFFDYIIVVLNLKDLYWKNSIYVNDSRIKTCFGGEERSDSIRNALISLKNIATDEDWIFVHDAARPCICMNDVKGLFNSIRNSKLGGILAISVNDTVKLVNKTSRSIVDTFDRRNIYLAQTPQVFRYRLLLTGYYYCLFNNIVVTDDSSVVEALGFHPMIVNGNKKNIKITLPEDMILANYYLSTLI